MNSFEEIINLNKKRYKVTVYEPEWGAIVSHYVVTGLSEFREASEEYITTKLKEENQNIKITKKVVNNALQQWLFDLTDVPFPTPKKPKFTFIDLFAGIGGFRIALQNLGGKCVYSSEWDESAKKTYFANFGEIPFGDITKDENKAFIPKDFDIICGGFPCQPFSIAGVSKKNSLGKKHGFEDEKQGNLFFHIAEIIEKHRPKAFFLENVKNLVSHDKGNTFKVIKNTLLQLGYSFDYKVLDGKHFVPQHRERTIMVGFDKKRYGEDFKFTFPILPDPNIKFKDILENKIDDKYTLSDKLWQFLQDYSAKHKAKGNGFGFGLTDLNGISRTISARYYKDGSEILIPQGKNKNPRRLTPRECARLQGYPDSFIIPVADTPAYKQFGNSVVMPLINKVGEGILNHL